MSPQTVRPEAHPITFDKLSKSQQRAVQTILDAVDDFVVNSQAQREDESALARLDKLRLSNVLLIDGERGSGKTQTLLTLLAYWESPFKPADTKLREIRDSVKRDGSHEKKPAVCIPVRVLDMQPLPRGTSLLMQLATRLYRLVEDSSPSGREDRGYPRLSDSKESERSLVDLWQRLVRAAASAEPDGGRGRNLTPEDVADELESRERERSDLHECWDQFVSAVAGEGLRKLVKTQPNADDSACLVISIDDADMNPSRCVELLDLVRSLLHPRVVFLLTGHTELFHEVLQQRFERDGLSPPTSARLARLYFDKVVPEFHRCPVGADVDSALKALPESVGVWRSVIEKLPELRPAVPKSWRAIQNLKGFASARRAKGPDSALYMLRTALDESYSPHWLRAHIDERIVPRLPGSEDDERLRELLVIDDADLEIVARYRTQRIELGPALSLEPQRRTWSQIALKAGRVSVDGGTNAEPIMLSRRIEAALYLVAISADDLGEGGRPNRELTPAGYPFAASHIRADKSDLKFVWPTPALTKTVHFLLFRHRWEQILDVLSPVLVDTDGGQPGSEAAGMHTRLVHAYLDTLCSLAEEGEKSSFDASAAAHADPNWETLAKRLVKLTTVRSSPDRGAFARWALTGATMFFWGEFGLPGRDADEFARCWLRSLWEQTGDDDEYQTRFAQVRDAHRAALLSSIHPTDVNNVESLNLLTRALSATRPKQQQQFFETVDPPLVNRWHQQFQSNPEDRKSLFIDVIHSIAFNVRRRESSEIAQLLDLATKDPAEHYAFHIHDRLSRILPAIRESSSASLGGVMSLVKYLRFHADMGKWPDDAWSYEMVAHGRRFRDLISTLGASHGNARGDAKDLLLLVRAAFANPDETPPDLSDEAICAQRYELPIISAQDQPISVKASGTGGWQLQVARIESNAWWRRPFEGISRQMAELLTSVHDVVVDMKDEELEHPGPLTDFEQHLCFTEQLSTIASGEGVRFMSPEPNWLAVSERKMLVGNYGVLAQQMFPILQSQEGLNALNVYCLSVVICTNRARHRQPDWDDVQRVAQSTGWGRPKLGAKPAAIGIVRDYLQRTTALKFRGRRWQAVQAWLRYGVPLYAAPESGMTEEEAGEWLSLFTDEIEADRTGLRAVRRHRAGLALQKAGKPSDAASVEALLQQIDRETPPTHAWLRLIGQRPAAPTTPTVSAPAEAVLTETSDARGAARPRRPRRKE